jgi:thiosulfate reductase cytochrome b subunit
VVYRHTLPLRIMHWINAACLLVLLGSGLQIFNAHPALYWGKSSYTGAGPILAPGPFPGWITLPGVQWLAMGRRWHFFFAWVLVANGLAYVAYSVASRHLRRLILMGLGMSPALDTVVQGWVDFFGGRQSVRTLHFAAAMLLVAFVAAHVFEVLVSGAWNNLRSMVTGRYRLPP